MSEMIDERPIAEPTMHSYHPLGDFPDGPSFMRAMEETWRSKANWARVTLITADQPMPPYPYGWYFEGWAVRPEAMDPPHREGPFNPPMTEAPHA